MKQNLEAICATWLRERFSIEAEEISRVLLSEQTEIDRMLDTVEVKFCFTDARGRVGDAGAHFDVEQVLSAESAFDAWRHGCLSRAYAH